MFDPQDSNFKKFLKSPHHLWLLGLTFGIGFVSANPLIFLASLALYALGWIYLPDMGIFQRWVKKNEDRLASIRSQAAVRAFIERRQSLIAGLTPGSLHRYMELAHVCQDIEKATRDGGPTPDTEVDPRLRKLDELMWTYLRLLVMEGSLESFLQTENGEELPGEIELSKKEIASLEAEITAATARKENPTAKLRLLDSKKERLAVLSKRQGRVGESRENAVLVTAEQERLVEQIKLLRADAVAARNADALTARIDATVENLTETNKLFSEMDQFKDLVADDLPLTEERLGYSTEGAQNPVVVDAAEPPVISLPPRSVRLKQGNRN